VVEVEGEPDCGRDGSRHTEPDPVVTPERSDRPCRPDGALGPRQRDEAGVHRAQRHDGGQAARLGEVGVAEAHRHERQAQRHEEPTHRSPARQVGRADGKEEDANHGQPRLVREDGADHDRGADQRADHDDQRPAPARGLDTDDEGRQDTDREREPPGDIDQRDGGRRERAERPEERIGPVPPERSWDRQG
jgi:hypothetical protein